MVDLNAIRIFVNVVRSNGLSAAAINLNMPKSTVSHKLGKLEQQLGIRLIQRTTRSLALTEEGESYFETSAKIIDELANIEQTLAKRRDSVQGKIRLNAPIEFGSHYLGKILAGFRAGNPHVQLNIELSSRNVNLVEEGYDLILRFGEQPDSSLICRKIVTVNRKLVASPDYLKRHEILGSPTDLLNHACIAHISQAKFEGWLLRKRGSNETFLHRLSEELVTNSYLIMRDFVRQNHGVCVLPEYLCRDDIHEHRLVEVLHEWSPDPVSLYLLYPSKMHLPYRTSKLIEYLCCAIEDDIGR